MAEPEDGVQTGTDVPPRRSDSGVRPPSRGWVNANWAPLVLMIAAVLWALYWLERGWIPHDDGALAQSAERVLSGQMPHADFRELYTGGLTYLHAVAFAALGPSLSVLRYVLLLGFILWLPVVWFIARRVAEPPLALLTTALAVVLSIPNYPASVPSWYLLFLATAAVAAVLRYLDNGNVRWLFAAGLCVGISVTVKISGLALLAALLLWLAYQEQERKEERRGLGVGAGQRDRYRVASLLLTFLAFLLCWMLVRLVGRFPGPSQTALFVVPGGSLALLVAFRDWLSPQPGLRLRTRWYLPRVTALLAGALAPVMGLVMYFQLSGELGSLLQGVLVSPATRFASATMKPPGLITAVALVIPAFLLAWGRPIASTRAGVVAATAVFSLAVVQSWDDPLVFWVFWSGLRWAIPALVLWGVFLLLRQDQQSEDGVVAFGMLAVISFAGLVQFPYSAPVYFLYVAPLVVFALVVTVRFESAGNSSRAGVASTLLFFLAFVATSVTPQSRIFGWRSASMPQPVELDLPRGGILIQPEEAELYEHLVGLIQRETGPEGLWAGPDSPELYFLSERVNRTPHLFEFLDAGEPVTPFSGDWIPDMIVLNRAPGFTYPVGPEILDRVRASYAQSDSVGRFTAFWGPVHEP